MSLYSTPISNHSPANDLLLIQMSRACTGSWYPNTQAEHWNLGWTCWKRCSIAMVDHRRVSHHDSNSKKNGKVYSSSQENYISVRVLLQIIIKKKQDEHPMFYVVVVGKCLEPCFIPAGMWLKTTYHFPHPLQIVFRTGFPMGFPHLCYCYSQDNYPQLCQQWIAMGQWNETIHILATQKQQSNSFVSALPQRSKNGCHMQFNGQKYERHREIFGSSGLARSTRQEANVK